MTQSIRKSIAAMIVMMAVALLAARSAHAQYMVDNLTGCSVNLTVYDANGVQQGPYTIPAAGGPVLIPTPAGFVPVGIVDANGKLRPFTFTITSPPPGCTGCIPLPAVAGGFCCADVCFDGSTPMGPITLRACGPPCP